MSEVIPTEKLTPEDQRMVKMWLGGGGLAANIAATVNRTGRMSAKQRACLARATRQQDSYHQPPRSCGPDYSDEEPDEALEMWAREIANE